MKLGDGGSAVRLASHKERHLQRHFDPSSVSEQRQRGLGNFQGHREREDRAGQIHFIYDKRSLLAGDDDQIRGVEITRIRLLSNAVRICPENLLYSSPLCRFYSFLFTQSTFLPPCSQANRLTRRVYLRSKSRVQKPLE